TRATRSRSLPQPTARTDDLLATARALLERARPLVAARGLTLVGVAVGGLADDRPVQLPLPFGPHDPAAPDAAIDGVRAAFGTAAVTRAVLLGRDQAEVPRLPDR